MKRKIAHVAMLAAAGLTTLGLVHANAQGNPAPQNEAQMFLSAPVTLDQAGQIALKAASGTLAHIGFNDDNGTAVYEASVVAADGTVTQLKIDATTGAVKSSAPAQSIGDEGGEGNDQAAEAQDGEQQDGAQDGEQQDG